MSALTGRRPVVLVGFMGAGKSTIGRLLAERLAVGFVDTDNEIVNRTGRSIPEIFDAEGEAGFRRIECDVVTDLLSSRGGVIALGGGSATQQPIRDALAGHTVVYLEIDADDGFARVEHSDRPLLAGPEPAARYRDLLAERRPSYEQVATITVAGGQPAREVVVAVLAALRREADNPSRSQD